MIIEVTITRTRYGGYHICGGGKRGNYLGLTRNEALGLFRERHFPNHQIKIL